MSWAVGYDDNWHRDVGYGVPATCDHPGCGAKIDRGLSHICCDGQIFGGEEGCGLYFCGEHLHVCGCERCLAGQEPFDPTPDLREWEIWKLTDYSWQEWRDANPDMVRQLRENMVRQLRENMSAASKGEPA